MHPHISRETMPDGRERIVMRGAPALKPFPHKERWRPVDAALMQSLMPAWWRSVYGLGEASRIMAGANARNQSREALLSMCANEAAAWEDRGFLVSLVDAGLASMVEAAALSAPQEPPARDEVIAPSGAVFFEEPVLLMDLVSTLTGDPTREPWPLRGVVWHPANVKNPASGTVVHMVADGAEARRRNLLQPIEVPLQPDGSYACLANVLVGIGDYADMQTERPTDPTVIAAMAFLRSFTAIARSPRTRSRTEQVLPAASKAARKRMKGARPSEVRVLSLANPEHGRYELDAATGRRNRAHWVRGHWRKQWYAASEEHRTIWIDGFVRGDASVGTVDGPRVYRATAPEDPRETEGQESP